MTDQGQPASGPDPKQVEWYAANLEAWFATRLERDKSLLTLSAGGIGLLITLVSTVGIQSLESLILFVLALLAFIACLASVLWIFQRNSSHIHDVVNNPKATNDSVLAGLDTAAVSTFLAGVVFSAIHLGNALLAEIRPRILHFPPVAVHFQSIAHLQYEAEMALGGPSLIDPKELQELHEIDPSIPATNPIK
jgi:hypothetical protein